MNTLYMQDFSTMLVSKQHLLTEIETLDQKQMQQVMFFIKYLRSLSKSANNDESNSQSEQQCQKKLMNIINVLEFSNVSSRFGDVSEWQQTTRKDRSR